MDVASRIDKCDDRSELDRHYIALYSPGVGSVLKTL